MYSESTKKDDDDELENSTCVCNMIIIIKIVYEIGIFLMDYDDDDWKMIFFFPENKKKSKQFFNITL